MRIASWLILCACLTACSWQNTLHTASKTPDVLRFDEHVRVTNPPRFRLPAHAHVVLVEDQAAPLIWNHAADAGLARVFASITPTGAAPYRVWVVSGLGQSTQVAPRESGFKAGLLGFTEMPKVPPRQALAVQLQDPNGQLIATLNLHISPALWGPAWSDPQLLGDSFSQLAQVLTGR